MARSPKALPLALGYTVVLNPLKTARKAFVCDDPFVSGRFTRVAQVGGQADPNLEVRVSNACPGGACCRRHRSSAVSSCFDFKSLHVFALLSTLYLVDYAHICTVRLG